MKVVKHIICAAFGVALLLMPALVEAHHVLGRPSYNLNEDSNTPPSLSLETQVGDYFVTAMVYPAFPRPNEGGRINFYATHADTGKPLTADVAFTVRDDSWWSGRKERLGSQVLDDNVYRQGFEFSDAGDYIITAEFQAGGETHLVDIPLHVGDAGGLGPLGLTIGALVTLLVLVSFVRRGRLLRIKLQAARDERQDRFENG